MIKIYDTKPEGFDEAVQVSACCIEHEDKILFVQRAAHKTQPGRWEVPGGKFETGETPQQCAKRELFEETGVQLDTLSPRGTSYVCGDDCHYVFHLFKAKVKNKPLITLSQEHQNYAWLTPEEAKHKPLVIGEEMALKTYFKKVREGTTNVNCFLFLKQNDRILLSLRQNTGWKDGQWGLVAGHVEEGEPATQGIIREAFEEIGIQIHPSDLKVIHVCHHKSQRLNIDIFFSCDRFEGTITNKEPEKCGGLEFFPLDRLPQNTIDNLVHLLRSLSRGNLYSEYGWTS